MHVKLSKNMRRRFNIAALLLMCSSCLYAQSGTNSPYSQFGLGVLSEQSGGVNRGMNGLGVGLREHDQVNVLNPASYSSIDSLSFIFDAGFSGQITNFKEDGRSKNAKNANFEYAVAGFRLRKGLGMSLGILPFTNVGYHYQNTGFVDNGRTTTYTNQFAGEGGLRHVFVGAGWSPLKGFSIGANIAYLWGSYTRSVTNSYSDEDISSLTKTYGATISSYKLDFGVQYEQKITGKDRLALGLTYGLGHRLGADATCVVVTSGIVSDTASHKAEDAWELPMTIGAGLSWNHGNRWRVGFDYTLQKWGSVSSPNYYNEAGKMVYSVEKGLLKDRSKVTLGGEYCNNENGRDFFQRIRYRLGFSYATPYVKVNGKDGPKELSVSAGFGIPIKNGYNNRSMLNISGQWQQTSAPGLLKENTFRINIGFTFNERWFMKWKFE